MIEIDGVPILANVEDILYRVHRETGQFNKIETKNSQYIMVSCPYHNNTKQPDMGITKYPIKKKDRIIPAGYGYCFGCHHKASLVEIVSNAFGYNDFGVFGKKWILEHFGTFDVENRDGIIHVPNRNITKKEYQYISDEELDKYRYWHPYLGKRYVDMNLADIYDVGYDANTKEITFPIRDINGSCLFVARRSITGKRYSYPQNIDKPIYGLYELMHLFPNTKEAYICESMFNCMTLTKQGVPSLALLGTGSEHQYKLLRELPFRKYIIALDNDSAGDNGAVKLYNALRNDKLMSRFIIKFKNKDINDCGMYNNIKEYSYEIKYSGTN